MSIYSLYETRGRYARTVTIPSDFAAVAAVVALGLIAAFAALSGGGVELVP